MRLVKKQPLHSDAGVGVRKGLPNGISNTKLVIVREPIEMKLLTKQTDYATRALLHLAKRQGEFVSSREIATKEKVPLYFLRRLLQDLIKHGLVESREGVAGGVRLKAEPKNIRLTDIIRIFQGNIQLSECMFRKRLCSNRKTCVLRKRIKNIEKMVTQEFENTTIADLIKDMEAMT
jgi:Rrf2 family cysteine metabolism transcriptional repressor